MDKKTLVHNFSRYACLYDRHADVQQEAAGELVNSIKDNGIESLLEIGCGTGNYTLLLRDRFKRARIRATDISERMIEVARDKLKDKDVEFLVGDAEELVLNERFDLVTSNACFQWFSNHSGTFAMLRNLLNKGKAISFSVFGPKTFNELNFSLKSVLNNEYFTAESFFDKGRLEELLADNFKEVRIRETSLKRQFGSLRELMLKIKYTGTGGGGLGRKISLSSKDIVELENFYLNRFGRIEATYQIYFCEGKAR